MELEQYGFKKGFDFENRFDLKTKIGKYTISTIDLGINHQFNKDLPPLYYETMIFNWEDETDNPFEAYQERYTTERQARQGNIPVALRNRAGCRTGQTGIVHGESMDLCKKDG